MNKMAEVAKLFDKECEEKFTIIGDNGVVIDVCFVCKRQGSAGEEQHNDA